jgi:uncharacterized membrane protein
VDCYYHHAVPSITVCSGCGQPICATCRSEAGDCPGCRLAARIDAAAGTQELPGRVPPRPSAPPPQPPPPPMYQQPSYAAVAVRPESRALVALGYPFWPLALLALFDGSHSPFVRKQAWQALGFNFGIYGMWFALSAIAAIPVIGMSAWPLLPFVIPVAFVASVVYGFKVWQGEDVRVPFISDYVESRTTNA